jgi:hypothetical protein
VAGVEGQPAPDSVPMHAQQARHLLALVGLATGQHIEHLQARPLMTVIFTLETLFEIGRIFSNRRYRVGYGLPSKLGPLWRLWRVAGLCTTVTPNSYYTSREGESRHHRASVTVPACVDDHHQSLVR